MLSSESDSSEDSSLSSLSLSSDSSLLLSDAELADEEVTELSRSSSESCCEEEDREVGDDTSSFEADDKFEPDLVAFFPGTVITIDVGIFFLISLALISEVVDAFRFTETALSSSEALAFLDTAAFIIVSVLVATATVTGWTDEELSVASFFDCALFVVVRFFVTFSTSGPAPGTGTFSSLFSPLFTDGLLIVRDFFFPPADVRMTTSGPAFDGTSGASICIASSLSSEASTPFLELRDFLFGSGALVGEDLCFLSFSGVSGILGSCGSEVSEAFSGFLERALFFPCRTGLSGDAGISISPDLLRFRCDDDGGANSFGGFSEGISGDLLDCSICIFERASSVNGVGDCST